MLHCAGVTVTHLAHCEFAPLVGVLEVRADALRAHERSPRPGASLTGDRPGQGAESRSDALLALRASWRLSAGLSPESRPAPSDGLAMSEPVNDFETLAS